MMTMKDKDGTWTPEAIQSVWDKAPFVDANHPEFGKNDPCKACIRRDDYGNKDSAYGWEVDHIFPESKLKDAGVPQSLIDHIDNLRPMHWRNNIQKSDNFPTYSADVTAIGDTNLDANRDYQIPRDTIDKLRTLYRGYLDIPQSDTLGKWLAESGLVTDACAPFFDDIATS